MESLLGAGEDIFAKGSVKAILEILTGRWLGLDFSVGLGKARSKLELFRANLKTRLIDHFLKLEFELVSLVSLRHGQKTRSKLELYQSLI